MLGLSKSFVIFLVLSIFIAIGTENWKNGLVIMVSYAIVKAIWRFLTE